MSFAGRRRPLESYERRYIRYRLVRLLELPDRSRLRDGILDRGDEVSSGAAGRLLASSLPRRANGWVQRMTLSAPASEDASEAPRLEAVEPACEPDFDPVEPVCETSEAQSRRRPRPETNVDCLLEVYMRAGATSCIAEEVEAGRCDRGRARAEVQPTVAVEPSRSRPASPRWLATIWNEPDCRRGPNRRPSQPVRA